MLHIDNIYGVHVRSARYQPYPWAEGEVFHPGCLSSAVELGISPNQGALQGRCAREMTVVCVRPSRTLTYQLGGSTGRCEDIRSSTKGRKRSRQGYFECSGVADDQPIRDAWTPGTFWGESGPTRMVTTAAAGLFGREII